MSKRLEFLKQELNIQDCSTPVSTKKITDAVNRILNEDLHEKKTFVKQKLLRFALIAAIISAISCFTAFAGAYFEWNEKLTEYFRPTKQQTDRMQYASALPQVSASDNGITVNVLQTLADSHGIYVLYEVIGFGGIEENEILSWEEERLKISYDDSDKKPGSGGYAYHKILDRKDNRCTILYIRTGQGKIKNQTLDFILSGLKKKVVNNRGEICNSYTVSDCRFELNWYFEYENTGKTWDIIKELNGGKNTLTQIDISPISLWITISGEEMENPDAVTINLKNGDTVNLDAKELSLSFTPLRNGINTVSCEFDKIITVEDIESIQIGTDVIPLSD